MTRNPTPELELEVNVEYEKGAEGKEVELSWRFADRIEASVEIPVVFLMSRERSDESEPRLVGMLELVDERTEDREG